MRATTLAIAGLLLAGSALAEPIASYSMTPQLSFGNFPSLVVDESSLSSQIQVRGSDFFNGGVTVGQTVVVSLSSGSAFDEIVALYTNGVTNDVTNLFSATYAFDMSESGGPFSPSSLSVSILQEFADLPDLAGWVIDEFRITSTVTCWDTVNQVTKDTCRPPVQVPLIELQASLKAEFFGHLAGGGTVPEPGSAVLAATALLAAGTLRRRTRRAPR